MHTWVVMDSCEQAVMGLQSQEVSANVTKLFVPIFSKTCNNLKYHDLIHPESTLYHPQRAVGAWRVCLFDLILYGPSRSFSYIGTGLPGLDQY